MTCGLAVKFAGILGGLRSNGEANVHAELQGVFLV
jgi:hypothetical protein